MEIFGCEIFQDWQENIGGAAEERGCAGAIVTALDGYDGGVLQLKEDWYAPM